MPSVHLEKAWATDSIMMTPESTLYDKERNVIYVSNINGKSDEKDANGFISRLKPGGEILELRWIDGLNAPKDMGVYKNLLYVADIDEIVVINVNEGVVVDTFEAPDAGFFNDISISVQGLVLISDSEKNKMLVLHGADISTWLNGNLLNGPNGLYWEPGQMMLASSRREQFTKIDLESRQVSVISEGIGQGDGISGNL